ncbi:pyridoxal phosphate-dependent aminotransferase [Microbulbifer halophilus]|uniref:Aminotransferase n=1 Tax=Microbulbifer halophilus TaxID=453963 RepID=A0ABW5EBX4_9GAMM|nr:aminotransferase class I/II-fold pyridoxal phosphate-dependent enzyme [Microbulbifer halophilus]MCW8125091.1 aminotransferase class I/II-fold pyridoxal phosphate-dependent enzyme [Microbulbifer halophilus]
MTQYNPRFSELSEALNKDDANVWAVSDRAHELADKGEDVIFLCVGDPNFDTPEPILDYTRARLGVGRTHYSPDAGEPVLRRAIADIESKVSPHPCSADDVVVFPGGTNAIYAVLACLLNPGEELLIPEPMYIGYVPICDALRLNMKKVACPADNDFAFDVDDIKAAIGEDTRAVMVNTPVNPTGAMATPEQLRELAAYCRERGIWLICDEMYSMITFARRHTSLRSAAEHLDNVVVIDGLSKSHAMSGWRLGWAVAQGPLVERLAKFAGATIFGCPQFIQEAAAFALEFDTYFVEEMRSAYQKRRDLIVERINNIPGLNCTSPDAGMFVMVDVSAVAHSKDGNCGEAFAEALLDAERVSVLPGAPFGPSARNHVRLTLAAEEGELARALDRIERFVASGSRQAG